MKQYLILSVIYAMTQYILIKDGWLKCDLFYPGKLYCECETLMLSSCQRFMVRHGDKFMVRHGDNRFMVKHGDNIFMVRHGNRFMVRHGDNRVMVKYVQKQQALLIHPCRRYNICSLPSLCTINRKDKVNSTYVCIKQTRVWRSSTALKWPLLQTGCTKCGWSAIPLCLGVTCPYMMNVRYTAWTTA